MMKGIYFAYVIVTLAYFPVATAGYAAYGNQVNADVLLSVSRPAGLIAVANFMVVIHIAASYQVNHCTHHGSAASAISKSVLLSTTARAHQEGLRASHEAPCDLALGSEPSPVPVSALDQPFQQNMSRFPLARSAAVFKSVHIHECPKYVNTYIIM